MSNDVANFEEGVAAEHSPLNYEDCLVISDPSIIAGDQDIEFSIYGYSDTEVYIDNLSTGQQTIDYISDQGYAVYRVADHTITVRYLSEKDRWLVDITMHLSEQQLSDVHLQPDDNRIVFSARMPARASLIRI